MKYTIILTQKPERGMHVSIPALPACTVEAANRDEAIRLAREAITQFVSQSEIVQVDVPLGWQDISPQDETPWQWFGWAKDDPTWDEIFEEIERQREATRSTE
jgi:predicted RNase H-like HicB family nuclease